MAHEAPQAVLHDVPCPRCGCHLRKHFACGCGAVHSDYCANCNRWADLGPTEFVTLEEPDAVCTVGKVPHEHTEVEALERLNHFFAAAKSRRASRIIVRRSFR